MIGALFVEGDDTTIETGMQDGQTKTWFAIGLHIPHMVATPMQIVAPKVNLGLATDRNAVDIGTEHLATIDQQASVANAVMMIGGFAIVVGPKGEAYPAPCGKFTGECPNGMLFFHFRLAKTESLLGGTSIKKSLALHGNSHKGMGLRGYGVGNEMGQLQHRVAHDPSTGVVEFEVQMRSRGIARIATNSNQIACTDRKLTRGEANIEGVAPSLALNLFLIDIGKALQVTINAGQPIGMSHIDSIAEAVLVDRNMADIPVGNGKNLLTFLIACLDVDAPMEMPRARLTEVACQYHFIVDGRNVFYIRIADRLSITATTCQQ